MTQHSSLRPIATARAAVVTVAAVLAGCATPVQLPPGTPRSQVLQSLGPPVAEYPLRQPSTDSPYLQVDTTGTAVRRLEYGTGSFTKFTYMLDFDAGDRLVGRAQVRNEARFNAVAAGMTEADLLRTLGRPSNIRGLSFQKQNVWSYRYDSFFCQWFQVGVGYDGKVVDTAYGPDPLCDDDGPLNMMRGRR